MPFNPMFGWIPEQKAKLVPSTKSGTPWELVLQIKVSDRSEAMILERKIKKRGAKRYLNDSQFGV